MQGIKSSSMYCSRLLRGFYFIRCWAVAPADEHEALALHVKAFLAPSCPYFVPKELLPLLSLPDLQKLSPIVSLLGIIKRLTYMAFSFLSASCPLDQLAFSVFPPII
jgi:hypothetical protein